LSSDVWTDVKAGLTEVDDSSAIDKLAELIGDPINVCTGSSFVGPVEAAAWETKVVETVTEALVPVPERLEPLAGTFLMPEIALREEGWNEKSEAEVPVLR
jgi:hypothetical protein